MTNTTYSVIDETKSVIYTIAPDLLPFFQTAVRHTRNEVTTRKFHVCDGQRNSLVARNVDMAWNPTQNNTFPRIRKKSIIQDYIVVRDFKKNALPQCAKLLNAVGQFNGNNES